MVYGGAIESSDMRRIRALKNGEEEASKMRKAAGEGEVSDRISELPDPVIHQIFRLMRSPREVARVQFLSKSWKRVFDSYGEVDLDQSWFPEEEEGSVGFKEYVENSLATRLDRVVRFRLRTRETDPEVIGGWIRSAVENGARELDVEVEVEAALDSEVPVGLARSNSIVSLKIAGGPLRSLASMAMYNLRRISIGRVGFLDQSFWKKIEENCRKLEDLRLFDCENLENLQISSLLKLKTVEVQSCYPVKYIKIIAPKLEAFSLHGDDYKNCRVDLQCSGNLRNLSLSKKDSSPPKSTAMVMNHNIWSLQCSETKQVDARNLYSFKYQTPPGYRDSRLSEVKFSFGESFWKIDESEQFKVVIYSEKCMKIFEDPPREWDTFEDHPREWDTFASPRGADLFLLENDECRMEMTSSSFETMKKVNNWLRKSHGESLALHSSNDLLLQLIDRMLMEREKEPSCCKFCPEKCWRHDMKDVHRVSDFYFYDVENTSYEFTWSCCFK